MGFPRWMAVAALGLVMAACASPSQAWRLRADAELDRLVLVSAPDGEDWSGLRLSSDEPIVRFRLNEDVSESHFDGEAAHAKQPMPLSAHPVPVRVGDFLDFCGQSFDRGSFSPTVTIMENATRAEIGSWKLAVLDRCG